MKEGRKDISGQNRDEPDLAYILIDNRQGAEKK
jgi:hypothetical protein